MLCKFLSWILYMLAYLTDLLPSFLTLICLHHVVLNHSILCFLFRLPEWNHLSYWLESVLFPLYVLQLRLFSKSSLLCRCNCELCGRILPLSFLFFLKWSLPFFLCSFLQMTDRFLHHVNNLLKILHITSRDLLECLKLLFYSFSLIPLMLLVSLFFALMPYKFLWFHLFGQNIPLFPCEDLLPAADNILPPVFPNYGCLNG